MEQNLRDEERKRLGCGSIFSRLSLVRQKVNESRNRTKSGKIGLKKYGKMKTIVPKVLN
jgi:hypothetical protein